jgi:hypothetical protein
VPFALRYGNCKPDCLFEFRQELLAMVPQPVLGLLMVFPITEESEKARKQGNARPAQLKLKSRLQFG